MYKYRSLFFSLLLLVSCTMLSAQEVEKNAISIDSVPPPALIWSASHQPDPKIKKASIFFSPHQDDETLGMSTSISEQVRLGNPVYVVLLTNGANADMLAYMRTVKPSAKMSDITIARNNEFIAACKALGVHRIYISNNGKGFDESGNDSVLTYDFRMTMQHFALLFPKSAFGTVSGNCDAYTSACNLHPTHRAAANAISELYYDHLITDIKLYRVYIYYKDCYKPDGSVCYHIPDQLKPISPYDRAAKKNAIAEYKVVDPKKGRYGLGYYHSVKQLFITSYNSDFEYIDSIPKIVKEYPKDERTLSQEK